MYQGQFKESFPTKFGHAVKLATPNGEWTVFGKGPKPEFAPGTPLEFEAEKKGQSWAYSHLRMAASVAAAQLLAPVAPSQSAPAAVAPQPTPVGAAVPVNADKERDMFVTGVVGRAMGGGQFSASDIKILTLAADEAWTELVAKRSGRGADATEPAQQQSNGGPPAGDPRFQRPPF